MAEAKLSLTVPDDAVRNIVLAEIQKQLGDPAEMIAAFVRQLMNEKERDPNTYKDVPRIQLMVAKALKETTEALLREHLEAQKPLLRAELAKLLSTKATAKRMAEAMILSLEGVAYRVEVSFQASPRQRY